MRSVCHPPREDDMARRRSGIHGREGIAGWLFTAPMIIILGLFLLVPIVMALWVSLTNWNGQRRPVRRRPERRVRRREELHRAVHPGRPDPRPLHAVDRQQLLLRAARRAAADRPCRSGLALVVNNKLLKGKSFFRTAFYFPSVTSSIAICDGLPVPLLQHRRRQRAAAARRHRRAAVVQRLPRPAAPRSSALVRRRRQPRPGARATSSGRSPVGLALRARRSRCASSSSWPSGPRPAPSC